MVCLSLCSSQGPFWVQDSKYLPWGAGIFFLGL